MAKFLKKSVADGGTGIVIVAEKGAVFGHEVERSRIKSLKILYLMSEYSLYFYSRASYNEVSNHSFFGEMEE